MSIKFPKICPKLKMYSTFIKHVYEITILGTRGFKTSIVSNSCGALSFSANAKLNKHVADKYLCLPLPDCAILAEYIWIDGSGENLRSRVRALDFIPQCVEEFPKWIFNGEHSGQEEGEKSSDMLLVPAAVYNDPFRRGNNKLVLCEVYTPDRKPAKTNYRTGCATALKAACHEEPMFGVDQEFYFADVDGNPFGWPWMHGEPSPLGEYYCGIGATKVHGRDILECAYRATLYSGVIFHSANACVFPSAWQFSIGPTAGIKAADDLWMTRFILKRLAEEYGLEISLKSKFRRNWHGMAANFHFSTKAMREEGGIKHIQEAICKLSKRHLEHIVKYDPHGGMDNVARLTGKDHSSCIHEFTSGIGKREYSVRIADSTAEAGWGSLEDRRPAANCDSYAVIEAIVRTCLIDDV